MKSGFFYGRHCLDIAEKIKRHINSTPDFLSEQTSKSTRAAGDAIEGLIAERFDTFLGEWCKEYSSNFARRAMADIAFKDKEDFYCIVDVKTHREDTKFNMPNLTSVERLSRFYEDDMNIGNSELSQSFPRHKDVSPKSVTQVADFEASWKSHFQLARSEKSWMDLFRASYIFFDYGQVCG